MSVAADVTAVDVAVAGFGGLDVICNNAGITLPPAPLTEVGDDDYDRVQAVNARGLTVASSGVS